MSDPRQTAEEYLRIAYQHQMNGRLEDAVAWYTKSIEACPTAEAHTFRGWVFSFQGRMREAIAECKKAIEVDPTFGNPYNDIGAYLVELGRAEEAIPWLEKATAAIRYEPRHFPHFNLARIYTQSFEYDKARHHLRKALEIEPNYPTARKELRKIEAMLN